jgi:hypothetical protein
MINTKQFALAGNATFTATSLKTGVRFTFKIRKPDENTPHFVKVLSGPNNEEDYSFIGTIFDGNVFRPGRKISAEAPSVKAFAWIWAHIDNPPVEQVKINHEGRCCRCGRKLTTPQSCSDGFGPECATKMGFDF